MSSSIPRDPAEAVKSSQWSHFTPRRIASLFGMSAGIGLIIGFAISHNEPLLFVAAALITVGYNLTILEERGRARTRIERP